jgi:hypothetical protein
VIVTSVPVKKGRRPVLALPTPTEPSRQCTRRNMPGLPGRELVGIERPGDERSQAIQSADALAEKVGTSTRQVRKLAEVEAEGHALSAEVPGLKAEVRGEGGDGCVQASRCGPEGRGA